MADIINLAERIRERQIARVERELDALRILNPWLWLAIIMSRHT